jgi:hypothetical protein
MRENQSIIRRDACHPPSAWNVCRQSRRRLEVENLFLRHQLNIALRRTPVAVGNPKRVAHESESYDARVR